MNSIRARLPHVLDYLRTRAPDVLCLQELKCVDSQFPLTEIADAGYRAEVFGQKAYNGVAILSKSPAEEVDRGTGDGDPMSRVIAATIDGVRIVCVYAPNGQGLTAPAYVYKLQWYERLISYLAKRSAEALLVCGDFNIAPAVSDTWDPDFWEGQVLTSPPERAALSQLMSTYQLTDLLRAKHPERDGLYTWWDYRAGAFGKNQGLRIDHMLTSPSVTARAIEVVVDRDTRKAERPSDHAPVFARLSP